MNAKIAKQNLKSEGLTKFDAAILITTAYFAPQAAAVQR
jgi:hypothetical protein